MMRECERKCTKLHRAEYTPEHTQAKVTRWFLHDSVTFIFMIHLKQEHFHEAADFFLWTHR